MAGIMGHSGGGFVAFLIATSLLFVLFGLAWREAGHGDEQARLKLVLGFGALFALTLIWVYPVTAIDLFTYVDQSVIMTHYHQNPIFTPPAAFPNDPVMALADGWRAVGAPYGPLGIDLDALPTLVSGGNLLVNLLLLKLLFSAMALACAWLVYAILRRVAPAYALRGALLVAWNPLILFEVAANGHNDAAMMLFVVLALVAAIDGSVLLGVLLIVASALVKFASLPLIPLVIVYGITRQPTWTRRFGYVAQAAAVALVTAVAMFAPFWRGPQTLSRALMENQMHLESFSSVASVLLPWHLTLDAATLLGRALFLPAYGIALWLSTRRADGLLRGCFVAMFFFVALGASNFKIWYAVWPALLAAATPWRAARLTAYLLAYGATISAALYDYWWPWSGDFFRVNTVSYAISFVPATLVLLGAALWPRLPAWRAQALRSRLLPSGKGP